MAHENQVIPIEVKAGATGSLKSLHRFMEEKRRPIAVRFNSDMPSSHLVRSKTSTGSYGDYRLLSLPFYLIEQLHRLIEQVHTNQ